MITLPLVSRPGGTAGAGAAAERDGAPDPSPNAGRSEAIYAHCAGVQLGGRNRYGERWIEKPSWPLISRKPIGAESRDSDADHSSGKPVAAPAASGRPALAGQ